MERERKRFKYWFTEPFCVGRQHTLSLPRALYLIWQHRVDLQALYNLDTESGYGGFVVWWIGSGRREYPGLAKELDEAMAPYLCEPLRAGRQHSLSLPRALYLIWQHRVDLQALYDLETESGYGEFVVWWLQGGWKEYPGLGEEFHRGLAAYLTQPSTGIVHDPDQIISMLLFLTRVVCPDDLQRGLNLRTEKGRRSLLQWWKESGETQARNLLGFFSQDDTDRLNRDTNVPAGQAPDTQVPNGVNLVGWVRGELGIGEDVRMAAAALTAAGVPHVLFDAPITCNARMMDGRLANSVVKEPCYRANVVFMPAFETFRLFLEAGPGLFEGRFTIGAWQWELPYGPDQASGFYRLVDEIWASTRFTADSFRCSASVPVLEMPMAVSLEPCEKYARKHFSLPDRRFLFLVMFDGHSWLSRKNPVAAVRAFVCAFPKTNRDVGIVIKAMHVERHSSEWEEILRYAASDERITIVDEVFDRDRVIGLIQCCDCYVSLHRAEGFGRIIAEAMLLGKPVIVTNFSGNTDFTTRETALLVDGPLVPLNAGDYFFADGQYWCDPNVDEAAEQMRTCLDHSELRQKISKAGQQFIREHYNPEVVGRRYRDRLESLGLITGYREAKARMTC
ncbi:glycosyltransferase family 4 protein [Candidatus Nitrospira bockiana]